MTNYEYCDDTTAPYPFVEPHGLFISKRSVNPLRYYGEAALSGFNVRRYSGWNPANWTGHAYVDSASATDWNFWKAKALAAINPFQPEVDLPLFLFELREFPGMLRDLGRVLSGGIKPRDAAGGYLAYNFGWAPLLGDLGKLYNFAESLNRVTSRLQNAANGSKVRRSLGTKEAYGAPGIYSHALGQAGTYQLGYISKTTAKGWCTARVNLTEPLPGVGEYDPGLDATRIALGLNASAATIWNAIPWSWLVDYFTNIGDLMDARRGYTRWKFKDLYCMVTTSVETRITGELNKVGSMSYSGGSKSYIRKERSYMGSNPNVGLSLSPMLSNYQMGILGALVTAGALRRHRGFS